MSLKAYVQDRMLFLLINFLLFILIGGTMVLINSTVTTIFLVFCVWFLPVLSYITIEFLKQRKFYNELNGTVESLDQKYLLSEVLKEPDFIEGRFLYDLLRRANRDMHEHVKKYRDQGQEYREYIETWVHEIKTPIASIRLIIDNNPSLVTRNITQEMKKLEEYIDQVLYYSRSSNVSEDYIIKEVPLADLIKRVVRKNSRDFISKRISVDLESVEGIVYSDAKWLEFIVNQVIGNAIKYSRDSDGKVTFSTRQSGDTRVLTIEDNGIGIVEKDVNRVFDKGFTGENGRKYGKSTGIGLYLCKKLAKQLGLDLTLTSEAGEGTKVSIIFPLAMEN